MSEQFDVSQSSNWVKNSEHEMERMLKDTQCPFERRSTQRNHCPPRNSDSDHHACNPTTTLTIISAPKFYRRDSFQLRIISSTLKCAQDCPSWVCTYHIALLNHTHSVTSSLYLKHNSIFQFIPPCHLTLQFTETCSSGSSFTKVGNQNT